MTSSSRESFVVFESVQLQIDSADPTMMRGRFKIARWFTPSENAPARASQPTASWRKVSRARINLCYIRMINARREAGAIWSDVMKKMNFGPPVTVAVAWFSVAHACCRRPAEAVQSRSLSNHDGSLAVCRRHHGWPRWPRRISRRISISPTRRAVDGRGLGDDRFERPTRMFKRYLTTKSAAGGRIQHRRHRMVRKSRRHQGHDLQRWPDCHSQF